MLFKIADAIKRMVSAKFNAVEFYDGQFEQLDEVVVNPPHAYIDVSGGDASDGAEIAAEVRLKLYVMTSSLADSPSNMLQLLWEVMEILHNKGVRYYTSKPEVGLPQAYAGRCFVKTYNSMVTYPGLSVWEVQLVVKRGDAA